MVERLSGNPVATFIPWIIFWVVAGSRSTWEYGALGALLASLILLGPDLRERRVKMLDGATVIFFAAMAIAGIIASPSDGEWLDRWANTLSSGVLGVLVLVTLPVTPFTEQYARKKPPLEIWNSDWTYWILPIALIVGAFKFTERYPEVVRARYQAAGARSRSDAPGPRTTAGAR